MRFLPRVALRIVEHVGPFLRIAEAVLMAGGRLSEQKRRRKEEEKGSDVSRFEHEMLIH